MCCQVELARWVGASTVHAVVCEKLPEAMGREVMKLLEEAAPGASKPQPQRFTRAEQARRASLQQAPLATAADAATSDHPSSHAVPEEEAPEVSKDLQLP